MSEWNNFCCPRCRGPLISSTEVYRCPACSREYPILFGLPDFRLFPDPYISFEDEYEKASILADKVSRVSFEQLVRFYWEITPGVPRPAVERYVRYALSGEDRGSACLEALDVQVAGRWTGQTGLEIGCGTGGFLLRAQNRFHTLVGADIALRWLVVAQKRLTSASKSIVLVCCSAEHLPFPDGTFDSVTGFHTLEHTTNQQAVLLETARTLRPGGLYFFSTPNRFSLGPEPCVRLWGVGFLPRLLAEGYVRSVKGISYRNIHLLSYFQLRRLLSRSGLRYWLISPARIAECEQKLLSRFGQALIAVYHALRNLPFCSYLLRIVGPFLQISGRR